MSEGMVSQAIEATGASYRQLDYWTRQGLIHAIDNTPGSGAQREWSEQELAIAAVIVRLRDAGFELAPAADIARRVTLGPGSVEISDGIFLAVLQ